MSKTHRIASLPDRDDPLVGKVLQVILAHSMFGANDRVVVGVSGGVDSLALLHVLHQLSPDLGTTLHIAHLDHQLRGLTAREDAQFVKKLAAELDIPVTIGKRDVPDLQRRLHLSTEEAARLARYSFFAEVVDQIGARGVTVGHNADDQVETILLHWLRGSGLAGLRGMQPVSTQHVELKSSNASVSGTSRRLASLSVYRPMLQITRSETEAFCAALGITSRFDHSNLDYTYLRNRIRHELLPFVEGFNPCFRQSMLRFSRLVAADYEYIHDQALEALPQISLASEGTITLDLKRWLQLPSGIQLHVLREAFVSLVGDASGLEAVHVESAAAGLRGKRSGATYCWPRGVSLTIGYDSFSLALGVVKSPSLPETEQSLTIPGTTEIVGTSWMVIAEIVEKPHDWRTIARWHSDLDLDVAGSTLSVRRRRPGDRLIPLGSTGTKKLQDLLVDSKIDRADRDLVPIITSPREIVWVAGVRIDDRFKVTSSTRRVLCLRFHRKSDLSGHF